MAFRRSLKRSSKHIDDADLQDLESIVGDLEGVDAVDFDGGPPRGFQGGGGGAHRSCGGGGIDDNELNSDNTDTSDSGWEDKHGRSTSMTRTSRTSSPSLSIHPDSMPNKGNGKGKGGKDGKGKGGKVIFADIADTHPGSVPPDINDLRGLRIAEETAEAAFAALRAESGEEAFPALRAQIEADCREIVIWELPGASGSRGSTD
jgi:hypothetical protein